MPQSPTHDLPRHAPKVPLRADVGPGTEDHVEAHLVSHLQVFPAQSTVNKMTLTYYEDFFLIFFFGGGGVGGGNWGSSLPTSRIPF